MRISEFLPVRRRVYLFLFFLGIGCILGLEYACWAQPVWEEKFGLASLAIFNPGAPGNLTAWFSSVLWFFAGLVCLSAFQLDRYTHSHRLSDIWLWAVFGCFLLSIDSACRIRDLLRILLIQISGTALYGNGDLWWIALYLILFGMIGSRLLVEMRHHLLACNTLFVAALSYILAYCITLDLLDLPGKEIRLPVLLRTGLEMLGAFFAVFSFSLFVRNMVLQMDSGTQPLMSAPQKTPEQKELAQKTNDKTPDTKTVKSKDEQLSQKSKSEDKPTDTKPEKKKKGRRSDAGRTSPPIPIVFPAQGGEKIVKVKAIEPLDDGETLEKLKKHRKKQHPKKVPPQPHEEEEGEKVEGLEDDTEEEETDDVLLEEEDAGEDDEYEEDE